MFEEAEKYAKVTASENTLMYLRIFETACSIIQTFLIIQNYGKSFIWVTMYVESLAHDPFNTTNNKETIL